MGICVCVLPAVDSTSDRVEAKMAVALMLKQTAEAGPLGWNPVDDIVFDLNANDAKRTGRFRLLASWPKLNTTCEAMNGMLDALQSIDQSLSDIKDVVAGVKGSESLFDQLAIKAAKSLKTYDIADEYRKSVTSLTLFDTCKVRIQAPIFYVKGRLPYVTITNGTFAGGSSAMGDGPGGGSVDRDPNSPKYGSSWNPQTGEKIGEGIVHLVNPPPGTPLQIKDIDQITIDYASTSERNDEAQRLIYSGEAESLQNLPGVYMVHAARALPYACESLRSMTKALMANTVVLAGDEYRTGWKTGALVTDTTSECLALWQSKKGPYAWNSEALARATSWTLEELATRTKSLIAARAVVQAYWVEFWNAAHYLHDGSMPTMEAPALYPYLAALAMKAASPGEAKSDTSAGNAAKPSWLKDEAQRRLQSMHAAKQAFTNLKKIEDASIAIANLERSYFGQYYLMKGYVLMADANGSINPGGGLPIGCLNGWPLIRAATIGLSTGVEPEDKASQATPYPFYCTDQPYPQQTNKAAIERVLFGDTCIYTLKTDQPMPTPATVLEAAYVKLLLAIDAKAGYVAKMQTAIDDAKRAGKQDDFDAIFERITKDYLNFTTKKDAEISDQWDAMNAEVDKIQAELARVQATTNWSMNFRGFKQVSTNHRKQVQAGVNLMRALAMAENEESMLQAYYDLNLILSGLRFEDPRGEMSGVLDRIRSPARFQEMHLFSAALGLLKYNANDAVESVPGCDGVPDTRKSDLVFMDWEVEKYGIWKCIHMFKVMPSMRMQNYVSLMETTSLLWLAQRSASHAIRDGFMSTYLLQSWANREALRDQGKPKDR